MTLARPAPDVSPDPPRRTTSAVRRSRRPSRLRRGVRRSAVVSHRWLSLVLGLVLVVICTSGAILLYRPELQRSLDHTAYSPSGGPARITMQQAMAAVVQAHPDFEAAAVVREHGVLRVTDYTTSWTVDPSTGAVLGHVGTEPSWLGFLDNLHECLLTCEGMPGYVSLLAKPLPDTGWLGADGAITAGGLVIGALGLLLLFLSLTGLWLWFPRPRQWRTAMSIRWRRGRFARDTDLHKVVGMIALPALLIWGLTAAGWELKPAEKAYYALVPGSETSFPDSVASTSKAGTDIGIDGAARAAIAAYPGDTVISVAPPEPDDATGTYALYLADGFDPYWNGEWPGDFGVAVDRFSGKVTPTYDPPGIATSQRLWDTWAYPLHSGYVVGGWWRLIWLALGISPLLLMVTGVSTWLVRRKNQRSRARAAAARAAAPA